VAGTIWNMPPWLHMNWALALTIGGIA
jgi:hypothetical protein